MRAIDTFNFFNGDIRLTDDGSDAVTLLLVPTGDQVDIPTPLAPSTIQKLAEWQDRGNVEAAKAFDAIVTGTLLLMLMALSDVAGRTPDADDIPTAA